MKVKYEKLLDGIYESMGKGAVSTDEVVTVVHSILGLVADLQKRLEASIETNRGEGMQSVDTLRDDLVALEQQIGQVRTNLTDTEGFLKDDHATTVKHIFEELQRIEASIPAIPEFPPFPSFDPLIQRIEESAAAIRDEVSAVEAKIPTIPEQKELEAEVVRDKLETLEGDERLDASAIKNLPKSVSKIVNSGIGGGSSGIKGILAGTNIAVDTNLYTPMVTLNITVSPTAPPNPVINELWIDST